MLEGLKEDTEAEIQTETKTEDQALETFQGVETSKRRDPKIGQQNRLRGLSLGLGRFQFWTTAG